MTGSVVALVCGSRTWDDLKAIERWFGANKRRLGMVITGGCLFGADDMAAVTARRLGIHVAQVNALWSLHGKAGGPMRNEAMLRLCPTEAVAFMRGRSPGTTDMVKRLRSAGIPVTIVRGEEER